MSFELFASSTIITQYKQFVGNITRDMEIATNIK